MLADVFNFVATAIGYFVIGVTVLATLVSMYLNNRDDKRR